MVSTWKYMLFLALAFPAMYAYAPHLEDVAKARWLDRIGVFISQSVASVSPEASVSAVDPTAAANVDEDLDYRIAQRMKSPEGWRGFLTAHPDGPHAQSARAELDKLAPSEAPPAPAQTLDARASDAKTSAEITAPAPSSAASEPATPASDEACRQDEDRLGRLSNNLTGDGVVRFLIDMRCEKLRPQLLRLAERLDDKASPAAADAASSVLPGPAIATAPFPPPRIRANAPPKRARSALSSRGAEPKRHSNPWAATNLPQLLVALFGERPRSATGVRRTRADGASSNEGH
jgi:hypothetical protein